MAGTGVDRTVSSGEIAGEGSVRAAFADALAPHRQPDGSYRQDNVFRYVVAGKPT